MEKINCVIVGAEGVMENGGIINKVINSTAVVHTYVIQLRFH